MAHPVVLCTDRRRVGVVGATHKVLSQFKDSFTSWSSVLLVFLLKWFLYSFSILEVGNSQAMVAHAFTPSTRVAEAFRSL